MIFLWHVAIDDIKNFNIGYYHIPSSESYEVELKRGS